LVQPVFIFAGSKIVQMILKDFLPSPSLREFVQCYRIVHFEFDKTNEAFFKAYPPKPEDCLHFFLKGGEAVELLNTAKKDYEFPIVLVGQQTSVMRRYPGNSFLSLQVVFQPTGLFRLIGIPAYELTNQYIDAEIVFSKNIRSVYEQLQNAKDFTQMLIIADKFVDNLASHSKKGRHLLDFVSNQLMECGGNISMDWLAKEACLCPKQFKRRFNERAGVNPKTYARIIRFAKAFNTKNAYPHWDWLRIAIDCGYYDYQHLVKDYKILTGLTPGKFHLLENHSPENKLGLAAELYRNRVKPALLSL
jgi:AraC-like DNA-binding protein